jgi:hypothetical protein
VRSTKNARDHHPTFAQSSGGRGFLLDPISQPADIRNSADRSEMG